MKPKKMQETHRTNFAVVVCYSMLTAILLIAYILEFVKKSRTLEYTLIFAALDLIPYIICLMTYLKSKESLRVKYIFSVGFSALYIYVLLTAAVPTTFVYIFLVLFLIIPYGDLKLCYIVGGSAVVSNIVSVIIGFASGSLTTADLALIEIQVLSVALAALYTGLATSVIGKINAQKYDELNDEKGKIDALLSRTLELSRGISEDIESVTERMKHLESAVVATKDSMQDVTAGATDTAEATQNQLLQTSEIVDLVDQAKDVSNVIAADMKETEAAITVGKENIETLLTHVNQSEGASATVASRMQELIEHTEKMNSIVELINSVTSQTSLLSLNASIEAARAGEAGRGFAVVAGEISSLANQTSEATVNITKLIDGIKSSIDEVFKAANQLMESNKAQNQSAETMATNFEKIEGCTRDIYEVSRKLEDVVAKLAQSNKSIVESINSVSAVTQEVSARANETLSVSESNAVVVEEITSVIEEINNKAKKLN